MLNGTPLVDVVVTFYPDTERKEGLPYARGKTDATGTYTLAAANGRSGAVVGKHRVVVKWPPRERGDNRERTPSIPLRYTVAVDTPLIREVKAGGPQTIDLVLEP
jgi:hypothetical protein